MSIIAIEAEAALKNRAASTPEPELTLSQRFLVTARSTTCKCVVTSTSGVDRNISSLPVNQCSKDHAAMMEKLRSAAEWRLLNMMDSFEAGAPRTSSEMQTSNSTPK